jgi:hypothetical protein
LYSHVYVSEERECGEDVESKLSGRNDFDDFSDLNNLVCIEI